MGSIRPRPNTDRQVVELVQQNGSPACSSSSRRSWTPAKADSWWQLLMLHGASATAGTPSF
jgi:hypothetical protein